MLGSTQRKQKLQGTDQTSAVDTLAYAQGQDIHLGPGQERQLPHEGWHVVQQSRAG